GLDLGRFELRRDQRVVLGAEVDLLGIARLGRSRRGLLVTDELVLALELVDVPDADLELVSHPGVGAALPYPCTDLVQVWAQGSTRHGRSGRLAHSARRAPRTSLGDSRRRVPLGGRLRCGGSLKRALTR